MKKDTEYASEMGSDQQSLKIFTRIVYPALGSPYDV